MLFPGAGARQSALGEHGPEVHVMGPGEFSRPQLLMYHHGRNCRRDTSSSASAEFAGVCAIATNSSAIGRVVGGFRPR